MNKFLVRSLLLSALLHGSAQAQPPATPGAYGTGTPINYVRTYDALAPFTNAADLLDPARTTREVRQTTQYYDGLGRPLQTVIKQGSWVSGQPAGKDLVSTHIYDAFGRESLQYLPFASTSSDGQFKYNPFAEQKDFYNGHLQGQPGETNIGSGQQNWAFTKTNFEASPLNRVLSTYAPGVSWVGSEQNTQASERRGMQRSYQINTAADGVRIWTVTEVAGELGNYSTTSVYARTLLPMNRANR